MAANAVARLMAVVVLPTPPFWLAIAKTFGAELGNSEENGVTVGHACKWLGLNVPVFHGLGQFDLPAFALVEKANSGIRTVRGGPSQQLGKWGEGPGSNDIGFERGRGFDPVDDDFRRMFQTHPATGFAQESTLP